MKFPLWTVVPFITLLLGIALLPVLAGHFWHSNLRKGLVSLGLSLPVIGYLVFLQIAMGQPSLDLLTHSLLEYMDFIILLASLYTVSGGIVLVGDMRPTPLVNTFFLLVGAMLANLIGTTGASMLLIRPFLRINLGRQYKGHLPVFFIIVVSNLGGLLTPLGDPPLFLGFLRGVDFFWTLSLWPQWLVANGLVLALFFYGDLAISLKEPPLEKSDAGSAAPVRLRGLLNFLFLAGILVAVLLQSEKIAAEATAWFRQFFPCPDLHLERPWGSVAMASMAVVSLIFTPRGLRQANAFTWEAIVEVAVLFIGIFITMIPPLKLLEARGGELGITEPWQFFWLTGSLSSFLDNAPTYLTFATIAAASIGADGHHLDKLMEQKPLLLQAISCGAVFMGAMTYIGNGPNFMVKAIAESAGYRTPTFFGYMVYSCLILLPIFGLITFLFFLK